MANFVCLVPRGDFLHGPNQNEKNIHLGTTTADSIVSDFNDSQHRSTSVTIDVFSLNVLRIINKLIAIAIAYGLDKKVLGERDDLIIDLGGGAIDVSQ